MERSAGQRTELCQSIIGHHVMARNEAISELCQEAIAAEKAVQAGNRKNKVSLINYINPDLLDLYDGLINE